MALKTKDQFLSSMSSGLMSLQRRRKKILGFFRAEHTTHACLETFDAWGGLTSIWTLALPAVFEKLSYYLGTSFSLDLGRLRVLLTAIRARNSIGSSFVNGFYGFFCAPCSTTPSDNPG